MRSFRSLVVAAAMVGIAGVAMAEEPVVMYGYAYDLSSGDYLYTERHEQRLVGERWMGGTITYYDINGEQIGFKEMDFASNPYIPVYKLELSSGYVEGISEVSDEVVMFKQDGAGASRQSKRVAVRDDMAADSGFHTRIRDSLDEILAGQTVNFRFAVAGNLDTFRFRVRRTGETRFEGRDAVTLRVEAATLLRLVAPSLELIYDPENGQLLEYRGISNIHDPATGKPYNDVRIAYLSEPPEEARKAPGLRRD
jgi:hypothetical protein